MFVGYLYISRTDFFRFIESQIEAIHTILQTM